jgi:hypothetical protein
VTVIQVPQKKPIPARPYARIRGKRERSVTEIIGTKGIPGLPWAAAKETALYAVHHDDWRELAPDEAVDRLRTHHRGIWDSRASMGTATHAVMQAWIAGETVDLYEIVCRMAQDDRQAKAWAGHEDEATVTLAGYVDGLERFWNDWSPTECVSEECVRTPGVYIGQRDLVARIRDGRCLFDIKSTAEQDGEKAIYHDSWALQLAAYDQATEIVEYGWGPKDKLIEVSTTPNERVDKCRVIHLRGDGGYALFEVKADESAYQAFLALGKVNTWVRDLAPCQAIAPPGGEQ